MNRFLLVLVLLTGIDGTIFAQRTPSSDFRPGPFELPDNYINRRFYFEWRQGNEIQVCLNSIKDLHYVGNLDSLIRTCLQDLALFKDSLSDELAGKKVDYAIDVSGRKKIRIIRHPATGSSFLLLEGDLSALKLAQDTIHILAPLSKSASPISPKARKWIYSSRPRDLDPNWKGDPLFEVNIIVNDLSDLPLLMRTGLKGKMDTLNLAVDEFLSPGSTWNWKAGSNQRQHLQQDPDISVDNREGGLRQGGDQLGTLLSANIQNYKNYFVPSFNLGLVVSFNSSSDLLYGESAFKYRIGVSWEPQFFFQNNQGRLQTYRNDFLTLNYAKERKGKQGLSRDENSDFNLVPWNFSLAYLINRDGAFYEKNTFRLGIDLIHLHKEKFAVEPLLYFNNFFKGVTPGLRLQVSF